MLFNSLAFLIFFPIVTIGFYAVAHRFRWLWLLAASCVFYMWFVPRYILILLATILIDYSAAIIIERTDVRKQRLAWLWVSVSATCLILFVFKYLGFFEQTVIDIAGMLGMSTNLKVAQIVLPIGLSFHTFQSLSYVIEVYRGTQKAERHLGIYSLYVMFYPQLVTGPIERPHNLLRQLREEKRLNRDNVAQGLMLMVFGLFAKMVLADNWGAIVDAVYAHPEQYSSLSIVGGLFGYSLQIYCDFFGYSTIALGCAKVMGYDITDNFKAPYLSRSIGEFWHRWHISLSTWFRDYVYIPLGGSRVRVSRWVLNTMVVFLLSGLWHGAAWTFVLWGGLHGLCLVAEGLPSRLRRQKPAQRAVWRIVPTFVAVTLLWSLFRAQDIGQLQAVYAAMLHNAGVGALLPVKGPVMLMTLVFVMMDIGLRDSRFDKVLIRRSRVVQWAVCAILIFCTIVFSSVEEYPFIYFQF